MKQVIICQNICKNILSVLGTNFLQKFFYPEAFIIKLFTDGIYGFP